MADQIPVGTYPNSGPNVTTAPRVQSVVDVDVLAACMTGLTPGAVGLKWVESRVRISLLLPM
jgi:hypothetical protein